MAYLTLTLTLTLALPKVFATLLTFFGAPPLTETAPHTHTSWPCLDPSPGHRPRTLAPSRSPDRRPKPDPDLGVLLVMLAGTRHKHDADSGQKPHMLAGDGVALLSAITYGAYAVQVKLEVPG